MAKKRLLLHTCCAACSIYTASELAKEYDLVMFFHNPQIFPATEYAKRLLEAKKTGEIIGVPVIEASRGYDSWRMAVEGLENEPEGGKRCSKCFEFNLDASAEYAKMKNFDAFTTTLTVSPHKNAELINQIGKIAGEKHGIEFLELDLKKNSGFMKSAEKCREHGIYRQHYCGCEFSLKSSMASPRE